MKQQQKIGHNYNLKTSQRQAFLQIFNLHSKEGKINRKDLQEIFKRICYYISQQHFNDICQKAFQFKQQITFEQFMETFRIKESPHSLVDIKNAFRLIAGDQDQYIPVATIFQIFRKSGIEKERVEDLMNVLSSYVQENGKIFNYKLFTSNLIPQ